MGAGAVRCQVQHTLLQLGQRGRCALRFKRIVVNLLQDVKAAVKGVQPAGTLAGRTANSIHWSPHGRNLVLAGLKVGRDC